MTAHLGGGNPLSEVAQLKLSLGEAQVKPPLNLINTVLRMEGLVGLDHEARWGWTMQRGGVGP